MAGNLRKMVAVFARALLAELVLAREDVADAAGATDAIAEILVDHVTICAELTLAESSELRRRVSAAVSVSDLSSETVPVCNGVAKVLAAICETTGQDVRIADSALEVLSSGGVCLESSRDEITSETVIRLVQDTGEDLEGFDNG
jgi:hypothetical protein